MKYYNTPAWALVPTHSSSRSRSASLFLPLPINNFSLAVTATEPREEGRVSFGLWFWRESGGGVTAGDGEGDWEVTYQPHARSRVNWAWPEAGSSSTVMHFLRQRPASQMSLNLPKQCHQPGPKCSDVWVLGRCFTSKPPDFCFFFLPLFLSQPFLFPPSFLDLRFCSVSS